MTRRYQSKIIWPGLTAMLALTVAMEGHAQNHVASELPREDAGSVLYEDMDGDGLSDVIVPAWSQEAGRELLVYLQQSDGRFPSQPSRRVEIKPEIIAVGLADLRPEAGKEVLLFTSSAVFSLSSTISSYTGNLRPLFDWEFAATVPDRRRVLVLPDINDMDGDGYADLMLPGRSEHGFFRGGPDEAFTLAHHFNPLNPDLSPSELPLGETGLDTRFALNAREGIVLQVRAETTSAFADLLGSLDEGRPEALLEIDQWLPAPLRADMNGDGRDDLVYLNIGNDLHGQLNILLQRDAGFGSEPDWQGSVDVRGDLRLFDVDGDGRADLVRIVDNSNEWNVQLYLNREGRFDFTRADQVLRFSGYDLTLTAADLNGDGRHELSVSYYTIPVVSAVRNASIVRSQLLFAPASANSGQVFSARPDYRLDETFSAAEVRGLGAQIHLAADLDGDGRNDAIQLADDGTLIARALDSDLQIAEQPFWRYVPQRSILNFVVRDMNGDDTPDLVLFHSTHMTVLVSRQ